MTTLKEHKSEADLSRDCENLTDMSVFELTSLTSLKRLSLTGLQKITDIAIYTIAEHAVELERLHLSYCGSISLDGIRTLLNRSQKLQQVVLTGVPSFQIEGVEQFSEPPSAVRSGVSILIRSIKLQLALGGGTKGCVPRVSGPEDRSPQGLFGRKRASTTGRRNTGRCQYTVHIVAGLSVLVNQKKEVGCQYFCIIIVLIPEDGTFKARFSFSTRLTSREIELKNSVSVTLSLITDLHLSDISYYSTSLHSFNLPTRSSQPSPAL